MNSALSKIILPRVEAKTIQGRKRMRRAGSTVNEKFRQASPLHLRNEKRQRGKENERKEMMRGRKNERKLTGHCESSSILNGTIRMSNIHFSLYLRRMGANAV
ncbi:hypothetical protein I7I53_02851 [Histoplasma capsulatum var. duboisii H88]|uniref:Uncharacterized protein n=1 Tax=Ajellomyces capsulatus (strain H88) TaxID=544711 RepID=A0A8A1LSW4_AJEC8|nr:hypothetical protein I7I53_02851 [Histoplasma capsulatum var. duboisii H88]